MMTVGQLRLALNMAPNDAEVIIVDDSDGAELPLEGPGGIAYITADKVLLLRVEQEFSDEESPPWEDGIQQEDVTELSRFYRSRRASTVVDAEFTPIVPEEKGDPDSTLPLYGEEA